ncbi:MFS transporter [Labrys neptuniae]
MTMLQRALVFIVLAFTQITGWGVVGLLPVTAGGMADDLKMDLPTVFMGTSVMYIATGLAAPFCGRLFRRFGARRPMAAGAGLIACGLGVIGVAPSAPIFLLAWAIIGLAGAMFLTTAAYAYLADYAGEQARQMIGSLMLVTGLAGSVFWPLTALLDHVLGWRGATFVFAAAMLVLVPPLLLLGLPETRKPSETSAPRQAGTRMGAIFWLLVSTIALNSFVTFGVQAIGIELFRAMGSDLTQAVGIASLLGLCKVGGRVIDLTGGQRWDGLTTALASGAMIPLGLLPLWFWGADPWAVMGYLALFGIGSGAFAVSRATMPLVFYRKADYAAAMSAIALPMNLINALAPPGLAALLTRAGPMAVVSLLAMLSALAFVTLLGLRRLHRASAAVTASD